MLAAKVLARSTCLVAALLATCQAMATDFGVAAGEFTLGPSWVGGLPPGSASDANINNGGTATLTVGDAIDVSRLRIGMGAGQSGRLVMDGGTLKVTLNGGDPDDTAFTVGD